MNDTVRQAERYVLGSMLRDNATIADVVPIVRDEYIYHDAHRKIFTAITELFEQGKPVDAVLLAEDLRRRGWLEDAGGVPYLGELWTAAPTGANVEYYARVVRDHAILQELRQAGAEIEVSAREQTGTPEELLESAERRILNISQLTAGGQVVTIAQAVDQVYGRIDAQAARGGGPAGLPTGLIDLDLLTGGLQPSEFIVIAARPSVGKTAMGVTLAQNAIRRGDAVFLASIEQAAVELAERLVCSEAFINSRKLRAGRLSDAEAAHFKAHGDELRGMLLFVDESPRQSMLRISANARRLKHRHGIKLVIVDYLQLVEPDNRREARHEQVAGIARRLKYLARELALPVVALAQLNREVENRAGQEPRLSDLRESGGIEADADVVLLLHRPANEGVLEVNVAKNRNGPTGNVTLRFRRDVQRIESYAGEPFGNTAAD
jgi:replicative DNA helicase